MEYELNCKLYGKELADQWQARDEKFLKDCEKLEKIKQTNSESLKKIFDQLEMLKKEVKK